MQLPSLDVKGGMIRKDTNSRFLDFNYCATTWSGGIFQYNVAYLGA